MSTVKFVGLNTGKVSDYPVYCFLCFYSLLCLTSSEHNQKIAIFRFCRYMLLKIWNPFYQEKYIFYESTSIGHAWLKCPVIVCIFWSTFTIVTATQSETYVCSKTYWSMVTLCIHASLYWLHLVDRLYGVKCCVDCSHKQSSPTGIVLIWSLFISTLL